MRLMITLACLLAPSLIANAAEIQLLPESLSLNGPEATHRLIVQTKTDNSLGAQIQEGVTLQSADPKIVEIVEGVVIPKSNGKTTITATVGEMNSSIAVTVKEMDKPFTWSFRNHVQSALSKSGCNMGACHGAAQGKNGFYLSLRGYDPVFDYWSITRQARGRRVIPSDPGRSLLLTKPTGMVPHKGGVRFDAESLEYRVLAEWIAAGQPEPTEDDPRITQLEILPKQIVVQPGVSQQFLVRAHFSDGRVEDVTQWAKYSSTNSTVADVDDLGRAELKGHGEGSIVAWVSGTERRGNYYVSVRSKCSRSSLCWWFREPDRQARQREVKVLEHSAVASGLGFGFHSSRLSRHVGDLADGSGSKTVPAQ
jgi:hypothetical protein